MVAIWIISDIFVKADIFFDRLSERICLEILTVA